ncbi:hypothetical protein ABKA04_006989 [Annulohypoxylon sp. FPYF3050]
MNRSQTAHLEVLNYANLAAKDATELTKLLSACQNQGFFYLDLGGSGFSHPLDIRLKALSLTREWFDRPSEEKMKFRQDSVTKGYKPLGTLSGPFKNRKDGFENIKMPRDDFVNGADFLPGTLKPETEIFRGDVEGSHAITITILSCLSDLLKPAVRFEDYHRENQVSQSTMMYFRYAKQEPVNDGVKNNNDLDTGAGIGHNTHTDLGTLTLLYCEQWGLQVYDQNSHTWSFVEPKPGFYVVNVGDALRFLSGNKLLSALHRVVPAAGHEGEYRYSTAYFLRPENDARFQTSENTIISALDWHDIKYHTFKADHAEQDKSTILTGGITMRV